MSLTPSRPRLLVAAAAAAGLIGAAAVALPAAGSLAPPGVRAAAHLAAPVSPAATAPTSTSRKGTRSTKPRTTTSRPHCTGCVEHQVFGFEDGTTQRWLPYGAAVAVTAAHTEIPTHGGNPRFSSVPHSGVRQLTVTGLGNGAGLRWPATSDSMLSGFQVRVWVRPHDRTASLTLRVGGTGGSVASTVVARPGEWTAITTPRWGSADHSLPVVTLTQEDPCAEGAVGSVDLDDTAVASSFTPEPPVWRADDASLLAPALPPITLSVVPCPTTPGGSPTPTPTSTGPTVLDFEDGTAQGWTGVGDTVVTSVVPQAAASGQLGLRVSGLAVKGNALRLDTLASAYGGSGAWFRLRMVASGGQPTATVHGTCAPDRVLTRPAPLAFDVPGAKRVVPRQQLIGQDRTLLTVWFKPARGATTVSFVVTAPATSRMGPVSLDDVVLDRGEGPHAKPTSTDTTAGVATGRGVVPLC
ncbi:MAG: hypothetical protein U0Q15_06345 [Kineosporiaceae bacterium]